MAAFGMVVDDATEAEAASVAERYGLDLEGVTLTLWRRMAEIGRVPFELDGEPNEESPEAIGETERIIADGGDGRGLETVEDVVAALGS